MDKKERDLAYAKANLWQVRLNINKKTEPELEWQLKDKDNVQGYIKELIKEDAMKRTFKVKPEFEDLWFGSEMPSELTLDEIGRLSQEWEKPMDELMEQLIETTTTRTKKTVYVVYMGACEIRTGHGDKLTDDEYAITNDPDPAVMGEFDTKEAALEYLHRNQPEMWVGHECGQGILRFIPIHGMWVAEEIRTYDEDGDLVDTEYAGTWDISKLPEDPEE